MDSTQAPQAEARLYQPSARISAQIEKAFTYHPPKGDQPTRYGLIRDSAHALARSIVRVTPESREQSLALTHLEQAVAFANAAIARNE
jgi:hypothetical protein